LVIPLRFTKIINLFAVNLMPVSEFPVIELDFIDSTNNYAMQLIDANKAQPGLTIVAKRQGAGKGQRGKAWLDEPGSSLLMSIIVTPRQSVMEQFVFSASVAVSIANVLQNLMPEQLIEVKWPNDIIINDKKAGGILIENILRGSQWVHSIVGVGINVRQDKFPSSIPYATSLKLASGRDIDLKELMGLIQERIQAAVTFPQSVPRTIHAYNEVLYRRGKKQRLSIDSMDFEVTVLSVLANGTLEVKLQDGTLEYYQHGQVNWVWGE
jgi:BirA family biotin operon repressor/biotin-[acetyl-CoA-carboxylase] ligase